jgi:hypothetical protein
MPRSGDPIAASQAKIDSTAAGRRTSVAFRGYRCRYCTTGFGTKVLATQALRQL